MVEISADDLKRVESILSGIENGVERAVSSAVNRSATFARTMASRKVASEYTVKTTDVKNTIQIKKATFSKLEATIIATGHAIPLTKFKVNSGKPVLKVSVKKGGGLKPLPGAFRAKMQSGHVGIFKRIGKSRTPIEGKYGPSIPTMLGSRTVTGHVEEIAMEKVAERLDYEIGRILGGIR
jgi:hypothetical protein